MHLEHPSPWLAQLKHDRPHFRLRGDAKADIVVIGAGIAGIATAYHLLKLTDLSILLVDAGRIAHGATGRNAGQIVSYFERPFTDLVKAFGVKMTVDACQCVENGWEILDEIVRTCELTVPVHRCAGYAGFTTLEQIEEHAREHAQKKASGLQQEPLLLSLNHPEIRTALPPECQDVCIDVPHSVILKHLATERSEFIALELSKKGCTNSALFCEETTAALLQQYPDRLRVVEHTLVERIITHPSSATLITPEHRIETTSVVLCTNGFEYCSIEDDNGVVLSTTMEKDVQGLIGYMSGYFDEVKDAAEAVSYYHGPMESGPYHYLTRRPYADADGSPVSLLCLGGPERPMPHAAMYDPLTPFPAAIEEELDAIMRTTYRDVTPGMKREFQWQGLMGYTQNGIRRIGKDPQHGHIYYNLGCNGVGILPSLYGGKRVAELVKGIDLPPSIFDLEYRNR